MAPEAYSGRCLPQHSPIQAGAFLSSRQAPGTAQIDAPRRRRGARRIAGISRLAPAPAASRISRIELRILPRSSFGVVTAPISAMTSHMRRAVTIFVAADPPRSGGAVRSAPSASTPPSSPFSGRTVRDAPGTRRNHLNNAPSAIKRPSRSRRSPWTPRRQARIRSRGGSANRRRRASPEPAGVVRALALIVGVATGLGAVILRDLIGLVHNAFYNGVLSYHTTPTCSKGRAASAPGSSCRRSSAG